MTDSGRKMKPPPILPPPITVDFSNDDEINYDNNADEDISAK